MNCGISGAPCKQPVVTPQGHVYEHSLLLKHIQQNHTDPASGTPLTEDQLIVLAHPTPATPVARLPSVASIPSLLVAFQNEWDAVVLQVFALKKDLHDARSQLANALYENDAAKRVVARLVQERDDARSKLLNQPHAPQPAQARSPSKKQEVAQPTEMQVDQNQTLLSAEWIAQIEAKSGVLATARRARKAPATLATPQDISGLSLISSTSTLHSKKDPKVNSLDMIKVGDETLLVSGGNDGTVYLFKDDMSGTFAWTKAHKKPVQQAAFVSAEVVVTASQDKTVKFLIIDAEKPDLKVLGTVEVHQDAVTGVACAPVDGLVASCSLDGTWALIDASDPAAPSVLCHISDAHQGGGYNRIAFHPDGLLLALATVAGSVHMYDIKTLKLVANLPIGSAVFSIAFSENGYHMACTGADVAVFFDLRSLAEMRRVSLPDAIQVKFDRSGKYAAVAHARTLTYTLLT